MRLDRIVCLANSYKHDHRCVAGISLLTTKWVRLAGRTIPGCLTREETCYADGNEAALLDVFEAELGEACPSNGHPEDVYVTERKWRPIRRFDEPADAKFLAAYLGKGPAVLGSYTDRVYGRKVESEPVSHSLELVRPEDLWWWIRDETGKRKNRALFRTGRASRSRYDLALTDPVWLERLRPLTPGIYPHARLVAEKSKKALLTVSLSEKFQGFHYKIVAGVVNAEG
jgi:hypothetical protein